MKYFGKRKRLITQRLLHLIAVAGVGLAVTTAVHAHHSWSEYDANIPVNIEGKISKLEWKSPHARLYIDVIAANGETESWNIELPSPNTLMRRGWKRHDLNPGDPVKVTGIRARNFPTIGIATSVMDADGKAMFSGTVGSSE